MRFALIDGKKTEATKGAKGLCPSCSSELVAKCGEVRINHWAHKGNRACDPWWENETEWHRSWKEQFPIDWQEVIHSDENGEKHIADVKTENDWVLEFQHSYLNPEERRVRDAFYRKLVWVVDGLRRKRDRLQFRQVLNESTRLSMEPLMLRVRFPEECRLLKDWLGCSAPVFFDFQEIDNSKKSILWCLLPRSSNSGTTIIVFPKKDFIKLHHGKEFAEVMRLFTLLAVKKRNNRSIGRPLPGFERYLARKRRK
jgi:hypothetical protein